MNDPSEATAFVSLLLASDLACALLECFEREGAVIAVWSALNASASRGLQTRRRELVAEHDRAVAADDEILRERELEEDISDFWWTVLAADIVDSD